MIFLQGSGNGKGACATTPGGWPMPPLALLPTDAAKGISMVAPMCRLVPCGTAAQSRSTWFSSTARRIHSPSFRRESAIMSGSRLCQAACIAQLNTAHGCKAPDCWAVQVSAALIVVLTRGGSTARLVAKYRPSIPVRASMARSRVLLAASASCTAAATCSCAAGDCSRLRVPGVGYSGVAGKAAPPLPLYPGDPWGQPHAQLPDVRSIQVHGAPDTHPELQAVFKGCSD